MIPWITSGATLVAVWLNGRNVRLSWKISLLNQAIWLMFVVTYDASGLLPLTLALSGILARHPGRTRCASRPLGGLSRGRWEMTAPDWVRPRRGELGRRAATRTRERLAGLARPNCIGPDLETASSGSTGHVVDRDHGQMEHGRALVTLPRERGLPSTPCSRAAC